MYKKDYAKIRELHFSRDFWLEGIIIYCGLSCVTKSFLDILFVMVQYSMQREHR